MVKSMTGFGRAQKMVSSRDISVEIKSVNHRYFEFSSRISRAYGFLEEKMKSYTQGFISRGKVDVAVSIQTIEGSGGQVEINRELAKSYIAALRGLGEETGLTDDLSLCAIARFSDIFAVRKTEEDEEEIWPRSKRWPMKPSPGLSPCGPKKGPSWRRTSSPAWSPSRGWLQRWRSDPPKRWRNTGQGCIKNSAKVHQGQPGG